jgi:hypothetical protein
MSCHWRQPANRRRRSPAARYALCAHRPQRLRAFRHLGAHARERAPSGTSPDRPIGACVRLSTSMLGVADRIVTPRGSLTVRRHRKTPQVEIALRSQTLVRYRTTVRRRRFRRLTSKQVRSACHRARGRRGAGRRAPKKAGAIERLERFRAGERLLTPVVGSSRPMPSRRLCLHAPTAGNEGPSFARSRCWNGAKSFLFNCVPRPIWSGCAATAGASRGNRERAVAKQKFERTKPQ